MRADSQIFALFALSVAISASAGAEPVILNAKAYLDVESGRLVEPATIVVDNGLIASVNPSVTPHGKEIHPRGLTLLPGLIDMHTHLTYELASGWDVEPVRWTQADFALRGVGNARKTLLAAG